MISRRFLVLIALVTTAASFFLLGVFHARTDDAAEHATYDARLDALRTEVRNEIGRSRPDNTPAGTTGQTATRADGERATGEVARAKMVAQIKQELQTEMGLLPVHLLRERRSSFVELYSTDNLGKTSYGTAGYLGHGYFITVKHAVVALGEDDDRPNGRKIVSIRIVYRGKE